MRFAITVLFAASLASAYTILKRQDAPTGCAQNCFQAAPTAPCEQTDTACYCLNPTFWNSLNTCVQTNCTPQEAQDAAANGKALCKNAGVDLDNLSPACAVTCEQNAFASTTCQQDDDACQCNDTPFVQTVFQCIQASCTPEDAQTASTVGQANCRANGVDISSAVGA